MAELWFAAFDEKYHGKEPFFFDKRKIPLCGQLEKNSAAIRHELDKFNKGRKDMAFKTYGDNALQYPPSSWSKLVLKVWGVENPSIQALFPGLTELLNEFPLITSAFISRMGAESKINRHSGETNAVVRIHLGLVVPQQDEKVAGIEVGDETRYWQEGQTFAFLDAHTHEAWNRAKADRYVLIIDLLRDEFQGHCKKECTRILLNQLIYNFLSVFRNNKVLGVVSSLIPIMVYPAMPFFSLSCWAQSKWNVAKL